jgi:hypothetical protein
MTKKQRIFVFVFAGVMLLAGIGAFGFIIYKAFDGIRHPTSSPEDRQLVVDARAFTAFGGEEPDPSREVFKSQKNFDGSRIVEYSYRSTNAGPAGTQLYLSSNVMVYPQTLSTMQMFKVQQFALKSGLSLAGHTETIPAPSLLTMGDAHYAAVLRSKKTGQDVGNILLVRQGRVLHTVVIVGIVLRDAHAVEQVLRPSLDESRRRFLKR